MNQGCTQAGTWKFQSCAQRWKICLANSLAKQGLHRQTTTINYPKISKVIEQSDARWSLRSCSARENAGSKRLDRDGLCRPNYIIIIINVHFFLKSQGWPCLVSLATSKQLCTLTQGTNHCLPQKKAPKRHERKHVWDLIWMHWVFAFNAAMSLKVLKHVTNHRRPAPIANDQSEYASMSVETCVRKRIKPMRHCKIVQSLVT